VLAEPAYTAAAKRLERTIADGLERDSAVEELEALAVWRGRRLVAA
jgi:hypothetical protein